MSIHHPNPVHRNPAGFLRKLPAVLAAFALIMASTVAIDQEPAAAACVFHRHDTWPNDDGWLKYSWAKEVPSHHQSTCNDVNVVWARETGRVWGQYLDGDQWRNSTVGSEWVRAGRQRPWRVVVENLHNESLYRVATLVEWRRFAIAV